MNENSFDSLISAYFDGELNDADRQAVDERLADDADARHELADYGQLSVLLRDLDRSSLPEEFTAQVMQRIERRTLLPQPQSVPRRSVWGWSALVPLAATAAVLLLMWALPRRGAEDRFDRLVADSSGRAVHTSGIQHSDHFFETESAMRGGANELGGLGGFGAGGVEAKQTLRRAGIPEAARPEAPAPAGRSDVAADMPVIVAQSGRDRSVSSFGFRSKPQDFEVGNVIEAIETSPTRVAVVKLWVVDRQEGLDKLQLLLARNDVVADDEMSVSNGVVFGNRGTDKLIKRAMTEGKPPAGQPTFESSLSLQELDGVSTSDGLVAIYVEAPKQKLAEVLEGLRADHAFVEVNAQPNVPPQLAQLERAYGRESDGRGQKPAPSEPQALARNEKEERLVRAGSGSVVRKGTEAPPPKSGAAPTKTPDLGAAPLAGPALVKAKIAAPKAADEADRESKRNLGRQSRFKVIDNPVELREVTAGDARDRVELSAKGERLKESVELRNEPAREPAKKAGKKLLAEDAKSATAGPLHVIFLVEQAPPPK